jgi:hypothetical protein
MPVWIGLRSGAFGMPWIAAIEPNDPVAQRM